MDIILSFLLFAFLFALSVGWGFITKWKYSLARLCTVAGCALISLIVTLIVKWNIPFTFLIRPDAAQYESELLNFLQSNEILRDTTTSFSGAFAAPIIFAAVFAALSVITWIINGIVFIVISILNRNKEKSRSLEMRLGKTKMILLTVTMAFLQLFITLGVLMVPVVTYTDGISEAVKAIDESKIVPTQSRTAIVLEYMEKIEDNPFVVIYGAVGGRAVGRTLTTMKINGEKAQLADELEIMTKIAFKVEHLSGVKLSEYSDKEIKIINELDDDIIESKVLTLFAGELVYGATDAWLDESGSGMFLGVEKPKIEYTKEMIFNQVFDRILEILRSDARQNEALCADLHTFSELLEICSENGMLEMMINADSDKLIGILSEGEVIKGMVDVLNANNSFKVLVNDILRVGMSAIGSSLNKPESTEELLEKYNSEIEHALNELLKADGKTFEEHKAELTDAMKKGLKESGSDIQIDGMVLEMYAEMILNDLKGYERVTSEDIADYFKTFPEYQTEHQ